MSQNLTQDPVLAAPRVGVDTEVTVVGLRTTPRALALGAFTGWLVLLVINAFFLAKSHAQLPTAQPALRYVFELGQLLGLAFLTWVAHRLLWRFEARRRAALAFCLFSLLAYGLLGGDLVSFLDRHPDTKVPWRALMALATAAALMASITLSLLCARFSLWIAGVALGVLLGVVNHLVLPLQYPGLHLVIAVISAHLVGMSLAPKLSALRAPPGLNRVLLAVSAASLLSFVVAPGAAVRSALLASPGAVAAPFVAQLWTGLGTDSPPPLLDGDSWFESRRGMDPIAPETLPGAPEKPIVILLTVDALRGDLIDDPGEYADSVANFTRMKEEALTFSRVWAGAPYTMGSLRSLFFGIYYLQHPIKKAALLREAEGQLPDVPERPSFVAMLATNNVSTFNVRTHGMFANEASVCPGFEDGTDLDPQPPADVVISAILERLDKDPHGPLFIYSHLFEPHAPYDRGTTEGSPKDRYVAEVKLVDAQLARLRSELRRRGLHQNTYLIITADHGEAFGEHGRDFHSTTVYEEMIRIPLLIEGPGVLPRRAQQTVSIVDLTPTILSLFGVSTPPYMVGQSLIPFLRGENPRLTRPLAVDGGRAIRAMLFEERYKAIVDMNVGTEEVYDLVNDPLERTNLADDPAMRTYITRLRSFFAGLNPRK